MLPLEPLPLRLPMLHSGHSPALPYEVHENVKFSGNIHAHLKFTVYGCKQTNRHTHESCNAVPLVWGSFRLVPIIDICLVLENVEHCGGESEKAANGFGVGFVKQVDISISLHQR